MINLTPIAKPIQERMFEKMSVLGRKEKYIGKESETGKLRLQDMATRTTFIRMTSGQENPVVMMGGELKPDGMMRTGYKDIYESVKNKMKRPMPGIKSIDVQFKGGVRALRTANISWTCWSFADLDRLMSHFLAHGKTVGLEWGWVYNKKQFEQLQTLIASDGTIDKAAFADYRNKIFNSKGDFDFMVGVIKNFEFTSRDDGGFDCKTDIVSTGVSILDSNYNQQQNRKQQLNVTDSDTLEDKETKLRNVLNDSAGDILNVDSALTFASYIQAIPHFLRAQIENQRDSDESPPVEFDMILTSKWLTPGGGLTPNANNLLRRVAPELYSPELASKEVRVEKYIAFFGEIDPETVNTEAYSALQNSANEPLPGPYTDVSKGGTVEVSDWVDNYTLWAPVEVDNAGQDRDGSSKGAITTKQGYEQIAETQPGMTFKIIETDITEINVPNSAEKFYVKPHCWIVDAKEFNTTGMVLPTDVWVRWGWFEDNVLSKFTTLIADSTENKIKSQFRSIEPVLEETGRPSGYYESTHIRNHKFLQTTDTNKYILPGQFNVLARGTKGFMDLSDPIKTNLNVARSLGGDTDLFGMPVDEIPILKGLFTRDITKDFEGDTKRMKTLASITNNLNFFPPFSSVWKPEKEGYLRNMLVNIKAIQEAFSFSTSLNIKTALETLFNTLNSDIGLWDLQVTSDEIETDRIKIIDNQITDYDFEKNPEPSTMKSEYKNGKVDIIDRKPGVFYFPVWQNNSLVKRQNLTAKIPSSMQLAAMYGANIDQLKNLAGSDETLNVEGKAAGAVGFNSNNKDKYTKHLDFIWKSYPKFGNAIGNESERLTFDGGEDFFKLEGVRPKHDPDSTISSHMRSGKLILSDIAFQNIESVISDKNVIPGAELDADSDKTNFPGLKIPKGTPMFLPEYLTDDQLEQLLRDNVSPEVLTALFGGKFDTTGKMKPFFIDSVRYLTAVHGANSNDSQPVIIPLDLQLTIDGIGGIFPGNSFHSEYVPVNYKNKTIFQCFDVNHTVDSSGWTVSLTGKMRATLKGLYGNIADKDDVLFDLIKLYTTQDETLNDDMQNLNNKIPESGLTSDPLKATATGTTTTTSTGHTVSD